MSSTVVYKSSQQPTSNNTLTILTLIFLLLSIGSAVLSGLVYFNILQFGEEKTDEYCPSKDCNINADNFTGTILSVNSLKNVEKFKVTSPSTFNTLQFTNLTVKELETSPDTNLDNTNFNKGFIVSSGEIQLINQENHVVGDFNISKIECENISFTNLITTNNITINSNIINGDMIKIDDASIDNIIYDTVDKITIKNFTCTNVTTSSINFKDKSFIDTIRCNNTILENYILTNNVVVKTITGTNFSSTSQNITFTNLYSSNVTGYAISNIKPSISCKNITCTNINIDKQFSTLSANIENLTTSNLIVNQNINSNILKFPENVTATNVSCSSYIGFKLTNDIDVSASNVIYDKVNILDNFSYRVYNCPTSLYETNGKINLFGINMDLVNNKINQNTYKFMNTIFINGNYVENNDININISFTNLINNGTSFNPELKGTSFQLFMNKNITNPLNNKSYIKINNLLPKQINFLGFQDTISINNNTSKKILMSNQENSISWYEFSCIGYENDILTYFISVK